MNPNVPFAPARRPLNNENCPYCGVDLSTTTANKEHVVARAFVPKGKLNGSWNLILRACTTCNSRKADLEDDLSSISMHPGLDKEHDDDHVAFDAERKASKSKNRRTGKPVAESEPLTIHGQLGPALRMSFTASTPPQPDEVRVYELARLQLAGFFYLCTFKVDTQRGGFWPGIYAPLLFSLRGDWGNPVYRWFIRSTREWQLRIRGDLADRYYKVIIRRDPDSILWAWALEWNRNLRIIGFFGEAEAVRSAVADAPEPEMYVIGRYPDGSDLRMRDEIPLPEEEDHLFSSNDEAR
jgi:hypothetical protein